METDYKKFKRIKVPYTETISVEQSNLNKELENTIYKANFSNILGSFSFSTTDTSITKEHEEMADLFDMLATVSEDAYNRTKGSTLIGIRSIMMKYLLESSIKYRLLSAHCKLEGFYIPEFSSSSGNSNDMKMQISQLSDMVIQLNKDINTIKKQNNYSIVINSSAIKIQRLFRSYKIIKDSMIMHQNLLKKEEINKINTEKLLMEIKSMKVREEIDHLQQRQLKAYNELHNNIKARTFKRGDKAILVQEKTFYALMRIPDDLLSDETKKHLNKQEMKTEGLLF